MIQTQSQKIYQQLENDIKNNVYPPKTKLPSENALAKKYSVSRETIRKVLQSLSEKGYIQKQQGKCSIVLDHKHLEFPVSNLTSYAELNSSQHLNSITDVICLNQGKFTVQHEMFPFNNKDVWKIIRTRQIDGEKVILDKDYLSCDLVPNLTKQICANSLFKYIENDLNLSIDYSVKEITVENITDEDRQYLDLSDNDYCVVVVRSTTFLKNTSILEYTESRHRADKFVFKEFARRKVDM